MEFRVLGELQVEERGRLIEVVGKQRVLLGVLLVNANELVSSERLIDALWGDRPPATAQSALQVHVSQLRKLLGAERIETGPSGYRLVVGPDELDSSRFERLLADGRGEEALALWRGRPLAEFEREPWAAGEVARLEALRLAADEARIEAALARGEAPAAELEALVRAQPFRERPRGQLMRALYRAGRQADALAVYQETRKLLVEELGIEPGPELQELHRQMLNHDPALAEIARDLPQPARSREERKVVTVLFCDLVGFTSRAEALDPEDVSMFLSRFHVRLRAELERFGGTVEKFVGDAAMALFGAPVAREDDAERAVRAALAIRDWIAEEDDLEARIGIATGTALVRLGAAPHEGQGMAVGDVVNTAARLQQAAPSGGVLVGELTYRATRARFAYERIEPILVKGKADAVPVWVAKGIRDALGDVERPTTPFVGRRADLALLEHAFARTLRDRSPQLVTVVGEPGIGKTRLLAAFRSGLEGDTLVRHGRCLAYGDRVTFWALGQIVKEHAGILESDDAATAHEKLAAVLGDVDESERAWLLRRLAPLVGATGDHSSFEQEEAFAAWARFLEAVAAASPFVLLLEDLHWADAALLAFVSHVVDWVSDVPLLVVTTARPELYEHAPDWGAGRRNATTLALAPLSTHETGELVSALLGDESLPQETHELLLERADGNPLFAEEFVRLVTDTGARVDTPVPESIQAVIAARLDTLTDERKQVVHAAAVVGKVFWAGALAAITHMSKEAVLANLHELGRKELVRRVRASSVESDVEYLFWHVLVRDVAYAQIPRRERADMHSAAAAWLERVARDRVDDYSEFLAYHYGAALDLHRATGMTSESGRVEEAAIRWTIVAAERAHRLDLDAARRHCEHALELMPRLHEARPRALRLLADVLARTGDLERADALLADAIASAAAAGDERLEQTAMVERGSWRLWVDPWGIEDARTTADGAIEFFGAADDDAGLAKAWRLRADAEPEWQANAAGLERALVHARRGGDAREVADALWWLTVALYFGPTPVAEAVQRCEEILADSAVDRSARAGTLGVLGGLRAMEGRLDEARELFGQGLSILEDLGIVLRLASRRTISGAIELLADDPAAAERELRWGYERLAAIGEHQDLPGIAAQLAEALYRQERYEEAEPYASLAEAEDQPRMRWRGPAAKLAARRGEIGVAEQRARSAVALAAAVGNLNSQGNALVDLAEVLRLAGRDEESVNELAEAAAVYSRKGNVVAARRVRQLLDGQTATAR
jgi:class 3 adenylate cyclase/tetratricopeptide (TPR) repeat protein